MGIRVGLPAEASSPSARVGQVEVRAMSWRTAVTDPLARVAVDVTS